MRANGYICPRCGKFSREIPGASFELDVHINGSHGTVRDGAADSAGQGESRVESKAAQLAGDGSSGSASGGIDLVGGFGGHCGERAEERKGRRAEIKILSGES